MQVVLSGNVLHTGKQQQNKGVFMSSDAWQHFNLILGSKITDTHLVDGLIWTAPLVLFVLSHE